MNLDEAQRQRVSAWIIQGAKLSEIQNRLLSEFGKKLTYMEVRFLVDDLKLTPKDPEPPKAAVPPVSPPAADPAKRTVEKNPAPEGTLPAAGGNVSVSVDQLTSRLGVAPKQAGYKPSAADVQDFQIALQSEIAKLGF